VLPLAAAERAAGLKTDSPAEHLPPAPLGSLAFFVLLLAAALGFQVFFNLAAAPAYLRHYMAQYVMSMLRVSKVVPPKRQIIKDISLSFFPGAKIGLLGLNGSGKSTVLKIMAGADKEFEGEVQHLPGIKIGYLPQEPQLDPTRPCAKKLNPVWAK
jgi:ABC-type multidrug transport system fused ATPase/permease subunit